MRTPINIASLLTSFSVLLTLSCSKEEIGLIVNEINLHSYSNNKNYNIRIALPNHFTFDERYNAIYVLDSEWNFNKVCYSAEQIMKENGKNNFIIVGIGWGDSKRENDYTPTKTSEGGGNAAGFLKFISSELIPYMEKTFSCDTTRKSRGLLGHSFGGLCAAYSFISDSSSFGNYIILSPSLWYDRQYILVMELQKRNTNNSFSGRIYTCVGSTESYGMLPTFYAWRDVLLHFYPKLSVKTEIISGLGHQGSKNVGITEGLKYIMNN